jgi:hypothetical protein
MVIIHRHLLGQFGIMPWLLNIMLDVLLHKEAWASCVMVIVWENSFADKG